jgi:hypothetical protein
MIFLQFQGPDFVVVRRSLPTLSLCKTFTGPDALGRRQVWAEDRLARRTASASTPFPDDHHLLRLPIAGVALLGHPQFGLRHADRVSPTS